MTNYKLILKIKWTSSIVLIIAMAFISLNLFPYTMYLQFVGVLGWFWVGILAKDLALVVLNGTGLLFLIAGIFNYLL
tara:strand:+ start:341 stop:571 length:231 start_codon:yes stop_codon:yes gene_type:complete